MRSGALKLVAGYGDIVAAGLTITDSRRQLADFTIPYLTGVNEVIVTHKQAFKPRTIEDLSGRRIFVRNSSSHYVIYRFTANISETREKQNEG